MFYDSVTFHLSIEQASLWLFFVCSATVITLNFLCCRNAAIINTYKIDVLIDLDRFILLRINLIITAPLRSTVTWKKKTWELTCFQNWDFSHCCKPQYRFLCLHNLNSSKVVLYKLHQKHTICKSNVNTLKCL